MYNRGQFNANYGKSPITFRIRKFFLLLVHPKYDLLEVNDLKNSKLLSALCYFSVFFLPLLLPFMVYLVTEEKDIKFHAKRSLISHLVPVLILIIGFIIFSISMFSMDRQIESLLHGNFSVWQMAPFIFTLVYSLLFFIIFIWNIFQGIKLLK